MLSVLVLIAFGVFCALAATRAMRPLPPPVHDPRPASTAELAWLAGTPQRPNGGPARLADVWWTQLHCRGMLVGQDPFKVVQIQPNVELSDLDPQSQMAARVLAAKSVWKPSEILAQWAPLALEVENALVQAGWIHPAPAWRAQRNWQKTPVMLLVPVAFASVVFLSASGWVLLLMVLCAFMASALALACAPDRLAAGGMVRLEQARTQHAATLRAPSAPSDLPLAVALAGPAVLMGTPWAAHASPSLARHGAEGGGCGSDVGSAGWSAGVSADGDGSGCGGGCGD